MQDFVDTFDLPFDSTVSGDATLWARFGIAIQGAWVFIDDDGTDTVVPMDLDGAQITEHVEALLAT